jgi:hypothetical protein
MSLSNDSMEGRVLAEVFSRRFQKDGIDPAVASQLKKILLELGQTLDGLGFCLSEVGDLLSQWRGYATDGHGFSIGFSRKYLEELSNTADRKMATFRLKRVIYNPAEQEMEVELSYAFAKKNIDEGKLKFPPPPGLLTGFGDPDVQSQYERRRIEYDNALQSVTQVLASEFINLYVFKNPAFAEEREWRLMSLLTKTDNDPCSFRASATGLIPYRPYEMLDLEMQPIYEVIIGPKNTTPEYVIQKLLLQSGFKDVRIRRSSATYR